MNRKLLSKAVGNINDSFIAEAYRPENDDIVGSPERTVHMKPKRLFTLAFAAALILSLGIAAYAVWSIHIARQQEIRSDLKIDENNAESYVEYSVADAQPHGIALLSAINDGEEQRIYLNVSPVAEEDLAGFPGLTVHSTEEALSAAEKHPRCLVLGGASIFEQFFPYLQKIYITKIGCCPESSRFFPNLDDLPDWQCTEKGPLLEEDGIPYCFCLYERSAGKGDKSC